MIMQICSQLIQDVLYKALPSAEFLYNQEEGLDLYLQFNTEQLDKMYPIISM